MYVPIELVGYFGKMPPTRIVGGKRVSMSNDEKLLKALAVAIIERPRATLKELAEAAGVSKATLHRFCGTRDNLVDMLMTHSRAVMYQIITSPYMTGDETSQALRQLIVDHMTHRELMIFLMFQCHSFVELDKEQALWQPHCDALDAFFLRGQQAGLLRIDISAAAMTEMFLSLIYGIVDAERRGRLASAQSVAMLEQFFLHGAVAPTR